MFFMNSAPGAMARRLAQNIIPKKANSQAIEDGGFLKVKVKLKGGIRADLAKQYHVTELPTMIILNPYGVELNRCGGSIGEVPFRDGFLNLTKINKPSRPTRK